MMEMYSLPDTTVEWIRMLTALFGISAVGLLVYRLIGRADRMSILSFSVTLLLAIAVLAFGLGAGRAHQLGNKFNELALLGLVVNVGATVVGLFWHRWLDRSGKRH